MELLRRVRACDSGGDLLCVEAVQSQSVACGSEAGTVAVLDSRSWEVSVRLADVGSSGEAVTSLASHPGREHSLYAACGCSVLELDLRSPGLLRRFTACAEEVNQVALSPRGDTLAAASDAGEVTLFSLHSGKALCTLRRGHANIVAALAFRPNRTAELLSAGLDARVVAWDTSNGRVRRAWDMNEVMASVEAREHPGIGGNPNRLQVVNPPMAHSVAVGQMDAANAARYAAVACGDGSVALLLLDDAPAAHVSFPAFSRGQPLVLSAGNDGRALLWDWGAYVAGNTAQPTVVAQAKHGAKLNWVATATEPSPARVYLADVSPTLAVYELRTG